jgi:hypothetical protein
MKFQPGQSGNPAGRAKGSGKVAELRAMLEPHVPAILQVIAEKARSGDLTAARIILDRIYSVRDATTSDLFEEIEELRALITKSKRTEVSLRKARAELDKLKQAATKPLPKGRVLFCEHRPRGDPRAGRNASWARP